MKSNIGDYSPLSATSKAILVDHSLEIQSIITYVGLERAILVNQTLEIVNA